jgi:hypothetical protein
MYWPYFWLGLLVASFVAIPIAAWAAQASAKKAFRKAQEAMRENQAEAQRAEVVLEEAAEDAVASL